LKNRPALLKWKVFHRGSGKNHPAAWYKTWQSVPEWKRNKDKSHHLAETMFHPVYTLQNNQQVANLMQDPLKLQRAMRLYPHDDNQGGFFVAVFEKFADTPNGYTMDSNYEADPWLNPHVRQQNLLD
jgi:hypothetical protein